MAGKRTPPDQPTSISRIDERVKRLERRLHAQVDNRRFLVLFSFSGPLVEDVASPKLRPIHPVEFELITFDLVEPGTGDVEVELLLDGALARTVTIPDDFYETAEALAVPRGSVLQANVSAPNSAEDLSICGVPRFL